MSTNKILKRKRRHLSLRRKIKGTADRPRLHVFRSAKHIYASLIDDVNGNTLASTSTRSKDIVSQISGGTGNCDAARTVGKAIAEKAASADVKSVVFDRGGYRYHGRVAEVAEGAREAGLAL